MKKQLDNKCITVSTRYSKPEYDLLVKRTTKAKKFTKINGQDVPWISGYTRMKTLTD